MTILNELWAEHLQSEFVSQLTAIVDTLEKRLLPNFNEESVEKEAKKATQDAWANFMSMPGTGYEDPGDYAELAQDIGISLYLVLVGIRHGVINLFAIAIHHAFEQQIMRFHNLEPIHPCKTELWSRHVIDAFKEDKKCIGIYISNFKSWQKINELRLGML